MSQGDPSKPAGSMACIDGSHYKLGTHGYVFRFDTVEWVRSSKSPEELKKAIARAEKYDIRRVLARRRATDNRRNRRRREANADR